MPHLKLILYMVDLHKDIIFVMYIQYAATHSKSVLRIGLTFFWFLKQFLMHRGVPIPH